MLKYEYALPGQMDFKQKIYRKQILEDVHIDENVILKLILEE
jgi:hypothetical protein